MIFSLTWLPGVLREADLKVALVDGWESRGRGDVGPIDGVICHHTAGPKAGNMPSLNTLINGRSDLPGPLSQLGLGRDGTYYVIAAGRCNHAGAGTWEGISTGNSSFIGIEGENTGLADDPWPDVQIDAYRRGVAAILKHVGHGEEFCCGHKEYALPNGRKDDPRFDMDAFRAAVAGIIAGTTPPPTLIPAAEPTAPPGARTGRPTQRRGAQGELVSQIQRGVGVAADGNFGADTEAAVREFQRKLGLVPDGIVGPKTWRAIDAAPSVGASST
jgi:peptidoglycan hydrolase-like protein with peptidoglycan-binding domain